MFQNLKQKQHNGAMESRDHFKNGVSPKNQRSRGNLKFCMILIAMLAFGMNAFADGGTTGPLTWEITGTFPNLTLTISGEGAMPNYQKYGAPWSYTDIEKIVIKKGVTSIGNYAFYFYFPTYYGWESYLTSVTIPNSVTSIGNYAFTGCKKLPSITIPNGVTNIGTFAFSSCESLATITLPNTLTSINNGAFAGSGLTSVVIPNGVSVKTIKEDTFSGCAKLTNVTLPNSITAIGNSAFHDCSLLTSVNIPNSVKTIGEYAFAICPKLTEITIPESVTKIGEYAFWRCEGLQTVNLNAKFAADAFVDYYRLFKGAGTGTGTTLNIGNNVEEIPAYIFEEFHGLTTVNIPDNVTVIWDGAFLNCYGLTSITIGENITYVGNCAFLMEYGGGISNLQTINFNAINCTHMGGGYGGQTWANCHNVTALNIGDKVQNIPDWGFSCLGDDYYGMSGGLTSITIPNSVTNIGHDAFGFCSKLTSVTIGNNVDSIGWYAFEYCPLTSITIPRSVTSIGTAAFSCFSIDHSNWDITLTLTSIDVDSENKHFTSENGVLYNKNKTTLICYPSGKTDKEYIIPNSVTTIGDMAFLLSKNLTSITIPPNVKTIGYDAFREMSILTIVTNLNPAPVVFNSVYEYPFGSTDISSCTLTVPNSSVSAYKNAEVWKKFGNIVGGGILVNPKANNNNYGYTTGDGLYEANATTTVTATAYDNCKFINWTKNGVEVSKNNTYSFTVTEDIELVANFKSEVGIEQLTIDNGELKIYPNPVSYELQVTSYEGKDASNGACPIVEIFDVMGRRVNNCQLSTVNCQLKINVSHLPSGIYFLKIGNKTAKFVKE